MMLHQSLLLNAEGNSFLYLYLQKIESIEYNKS